jgi:hypothetical protein
MFVKAIERAKEFTRPVHIITRLYNQADILPGAATLFFVNDQGCAVTCRHVAETLINGPQAQQHYNQFAGERAKLVKNQEYNFKLQRLEKQYNLALGTLIAQKINFIDCVDSLTQIDVTYHSKYDLALLKFTTNGRFHYGRPAEFVADGHLPKQGQSLCRLGYPFPEFNNFGYNATIDDIEWTKGGHQASVPFPLDGILTRHINDETGYNYALEMSTPGLRGQSGGPLFDTNGVVYGMQFATRHLHLGFDMVNYEVWLNAHRAKVSNHPFLHVGLCINAETIKEFLRQQGVKYYQSRP